MIKYKIDVMAALKEKGYNTYVIKKQNLLSQSTLTRLRAGVIVRDDALSRICELLQCQPGDVLEYVADDPDASEKN